MKKCENCKFENTDVMNYCLECGEELDAEATVFVPVESISSLETEQFSEPETEEFENDTIVNTRFAVQPKHSKHNSPPVDSGFNTKFYLAVGGGLFALVALFTVVAAGVVFYAVNQRDEKPIRPIASKTPVEDFPENETESETITFPAPTKPTKRLTYKVRTVTGWQLSEIKTVPLENFRIRVSGSVKMDGVRRSVSAKGVKGFEDRKILQDFPAGALLMRTHYPDGRHSIIQQVAAGEYWQNDKDETGKIEFLVNDNSPENNRGEYTIKFTMLNVPEK